MPNGPGRSARGAAVLQVDLTRSIHRAVLDELVAVGYARLSMDAVARRAGAGKASLYRRWPSKQDMVIDVVAAFSVPRVSDADTGDLSSDVREVFAAVTSWLAHPQFCRVLPDLVAEGNRNPELAAAIGGAIGKPRRELTMAVIDRAIARGDLRPDLDRELAVDLLAAPVYWRRSVRFASVDEDYLDVLTRATVAALRAL